MELRTKVQPEHNDFTRSLTFTNHFGDSKRLAIAFGKAGECLTRALDRSFWVGSVTL